MIILKVSVKSQKLTWHLWKDKYAKEDIIQSCKDNFEKIEEGTL